MSEIIKINKPIILKFENREIYLPDELKEKINVFWNNAIKENPHLYNGEEFVVEKIEEMDNEIKMTVIKSKYAHYLYDERIGIAEKKYRCYAPWGGIFLLTSDNYFVLGEMDETTSMPHCLQISGGGVDNKDIIDGNIEITRTIKRELKEELNIDLEDIEYTLEFIEHSDDTRKAYGFIALGNLKITKKELEQYFYEYKEYLINNNLELEFSNLIFINKERALKELDSITNPKRSYLRPLIECIKEEGIK